MDIHVKNLHKEKTHAPGQTCTFQHAAHISSYAARAVSLVSSACACDASRGHLRGRAAHRLHRQKTLVLGRLVDW